MPIATDIIQIRSKNHVADAAARGAVALGEGKLVGFATETVYGLAALASRPKAMERLREIKSRPKKPFSVHLSCSTEIDRYVRDIPSRAGRLIAKAWPGPVTLLLETAGHLADKDLQAAGLHDVLSPAGLIGLRCPQGPVCEAILSAVDGPVVAASANLAKRPSPRTGSQVLESLHGQIDLLIDSGPTTYGKDSTIVKFSGEDFRIVRQGVLDDRSIHRLMQRTILFVCTGNTCRSSMAAALARKILAQRWGLDVEKLSHNDLEVVSAGIWATDGQKATPEAIRAAKKLGADLSQHRSQKLTIELINSADLIFCMTDFHVKEVRRMAPSAADRLQRLDADLDILDPIGGGARIYQTTADRIQKAIRIRLNEARL